MAEPFSSFFGNTTLDKPPEDYTSALLGKKPKENAFASPQVNPMMAQTQILGQPQVAPMPLPQSQEGVANPFEQAPAPVASAPVAPAPAAPDPRNIPGSPAYMANQPDYLTNPKYHPTHVNVYGKDTGITKSILDRTIESFFGVDTSNPVAEGKEYNPTFPERPEPKLLSPSLPQSQEGVANPFADPAPAPAQTMGLSQQGIADALARTKAEGVEVDPNSPQANFLREKERLGGQPMTNDQIAQATRLAASMGATFDPETGYSRDAFLAGEPAPRPNNLTTVGGTPLNEFLSGAAIPDQGFARAENAMYGDNSLSRGLGGDAAMKAFQDASAAREARLEARPDFGQAFGGASDTTSAGLTEGDYRNILREQGVTGSAQVAGAKKMMAEQVIADDAAKAAAEAAEAEAAAANAPVAPKPLTESERLARLKWEYQKEQDALEAKAKAAGITKERYDKMVKAAGALNSLKADLELVESQGKEVKDLTLKPLTATEGILGKALATLSPASTAAELERASSVLKGDAFIKGMQVIKEFGGGLGSVTEEEGRNVQRAQGAIFEAGMPDKERRDAVDTYIKVRQKAYDRIRAAFVDEFGEPAAKEYLGESSGSTKSSGSTQGSEVTTSDGQYTATVVTD